MKFPCLILTILLLLSAIGRADENGVPEILPKGFDTYQKFGARSAVETWLAGSASESADKDQVLTKIGKIESGYGKFAGFELLRVVKLTPSARRVYVGVKYEKGMAWMFFDCYRLASGWIVTRFDLSSKADEVIPGNILEGN